MSTQNTQALFAAARQINQESNINQSPEQSDSAGVKHFMFKWGNKIKDFGSVAYLLDVIESNGNEIDDFINHSSNIDEWFNAYLASDDFASMTADMRRAAIKAKEAVRYLVQDAIYFLSQNELGIYNPNE